MAVFGIVKYFAGMSAAVISLGILGLIGFLLRDKIFDQIVKSINPKSILLLQPSKSRLTTLYSLANNYKLISKFNKMISIQNISKVYGANKVLNIHELSIPKGETFGLVGNNGAGKTTLFSVLLDLIAPSSGFISIDNIKVNESEAWKTKLSAFIDESFLIGYLTPEEYFYFLGELRGQNRASVDEFLKQFSDLFNGEILNAGKYIRTFLKGI